jgi:hypothetical protein
MKNCSHLPNVVKSHGIALLTVLLFATKPGLAQQQSTNVTESRDASLTYIGAINFSIGRIAAECLAITSRSETPQQFVAAWQLRNAKFVNAAAVYMEKRLEEAQLEGGAERRAAVYRELTNVARTSGETVARRLLQNNAKDDACKRALALIEGRVFDFSPQMPNYKELESLVTWANK